MATRRHARNDPAPPHALIELSIDALCFPARGVRAADEAHAQGIARGIATVGVCVPFLLGRDNLVLDGRSRIEAARRPGFVKIPCIRADGLPDDDVN